MRRAAALIFCLSALCPGRAGAAPVRIGSKVFTESVILGEVVAQLLRDKGVPAEHRRQLGGTQILIRALQQGEIDVYPEYTGTLREQIFAGQVGPEPGALERLLAGRGLRMGPPLGFSDTYALAVRKQVAEARGLRAISDLVAHPDLRLGLSAEFMERGDGWPGLKARYGLPQRPEGLDHDLAYRGLKGGTLDGTEVYSTDAEIRYYDLRVLQDDRRYFPEYQAVLLYRADLPARAPGAMAALELLSGRLSEEAMSALNARAKLERVPEGEVAAGFLQSRLGIRPLKQAREGLLLRLGKRTAEHLRLVLLSLLLAVLVSVPLGVLASLHRGLGQVLLGAVGVLQTIPSLALLVFMIPLLGIGQLPAMVALFLYSLLPIVRNTYTGLRDIPPPLRESAEALGLSRMAQLVRVELPLASPAILAGIKTAAVLNVGTATIGAIIGAGGYGQAILTGIRLDDHAMILEGALPAAGLALLMQALFEGVERVLVPRGLRLAPRA